MSSWKNISIFKFQRVSEINERKDMSDLDKLLFSICSVYNMTEHELDNAGVKKAGRLAKKVEKIFSSPLNALPKKRIGKYILNYDPGSMTLGQYIELSYFLSENPIVHAHKVIASISRVTFRKHSTANHNKKANYFLTQPVPDIIGSLNLFMSRLTSFNAEYKWLFGLDGETHGDAQADQFNKKYGWIYSASIVAEYERITLDEAYGLPVRHAFNDLAYLKAKSKYEATQIKKK
jgi:hypothetical protein